MKLRVCIILVNWNGWQDTVVGLDALRRQQGVDYLTVVVDNGSTNESVGEIMRWAADSAPSVRVEHLRREQAQAEEVMDSARSWYASTMERLVLVEAGENLGFARGNNLAIPMALASGADFIWLLNNDAAAEPTTAAELARFLALHPQYGAVTPVILNMGTETVANCGGYINWLGLRSYSSVGRRRSELPGGWINVNYVTGCAMMIPTAVMRVHGPLDERFFFGEEDVQLSHRLSEAGLKLACVTSAAVGHKFGTSFKKSGKSDIARAYVFYINRFVGNRYMMHRLIWQLHRYVHLAYALVTLARRYGAGPADLRTFARVLMRDSATLDGVSREYYQRLMREGLDGLA